MNVSNSQSSVMQDLLQFPIWLDEQAVAQRLKVSVYTIQRMRKRGELKAKRIGAQWRYRSDWLREYEDKADTPCQKISGSEGSSLNAVATVRPGARAGSIQKADKRDVHRSAQEIFKRPKSA